VISCREDSSGWEDGVAIVIAETGSPSLWVGEEEIEPAGDPLGWLESTRNCGRPW
jgi:hypothetical protein